MLMGGRVAEEMVFDQQTTGAGQDINHATNLARKMVCVWGMSNLGPLSYEGESQEVFLGKEFSRVRGFSESTAERIDREIRRIVDTSFDRARQILRQHMEVLEDMAQELIVRETLGQKDVLEILRRHELTMQGIKEEAPEAVEEPNPEDIEG